MSNLFESIIFAAIMTILGAVFGGLIMFKVGRDDILEQCRGFASFPINEKERMICVIKPDIPLMEGGQEYMRPSGSKVIKPKVM